MIAGSHPIVSLIQEERRSFREDYIVVSGNYRFNTYKTIQRIDDYEYSRFHESHPVDEDGFVKPFYNINRAPRAIASKELDLDTKDVLIRARKGNYYIAELEAFELRSWMKKQGFAEFLNDTGDTAPSGHVVVKKNKEGKWSVCDLKTLSVADQMAESLFLATPTEEHHMSVKDVLNNEGWDETERKEAALHYQQLGKNKIPIFERWGWVKENLIDEKGSDEKYVYALAIIAGGNLADDIPREEGDDEPPAFKLFFDKVDESKFPYDEWKFIKVRNRWLGLGFTEILFDPQVRVNELAYYKSKGLRWTGLHIFSTDDTSVESNQLYDVRDGQIIKLLPGKAITPIVTEERNLAAYASEERRWDENAAQLTFSPAIAGGENLPSGTPARAAILQDENFKRFFDRKREDFGIFVQRLVEKTIFPRFKQHIKKAHVFSFEEFGEQRDKLEELIVTSRAAKKFGEYLSRGSLPSMLQWQQDLAVIIRQVSTDNIRFDIPDGAYDDLDDYVEIVITKENEDSDAKLKGAQLLMQTLATNPTIALNPVTRPYFMEFTHLLGMKQVRVPSQMNALQGIQGIQEQTGSPMMDNSAPPPGGNTNNQPILNRVPL